MAEHTHNLCTYSCGRTYMSMLGPIASQHHTISIFWPWLNKELNVSLKNAKKKIQESSIHHHMHHYKASLLACKWYQHQSTLAEYHLHDIVKIWTMGYLELKLTTKTCMHLMEHHQTYLSLSNHHSRFPQSSFSFFFFLLFGQKQHESFSLLFFWSCMRMTNTFFSLCFLPSISY